MEALGVGLRFRDCGRWVVRDKDPVKGVAVMVFTGSAFLLMIFWERVLTLLLGP